MANVQKLTFDLTVKFPGLAKSKNYSMHGIQHKCTGNMEGIEVTVSALYLTSIFSLYSTDITLLFTLVCIRIKWHPCSTLIAACTPCSPCTACGAE